VSTDTVALFLALLSLACWAGTVAAVVGLALRRSSAGVATIVDDLGALALWLAWVVAAVATLGSLYFSEVAHYVPCELCWFQRICMYPLSVILLVAAVRRDRAIWVYAGPVAAVGAAVAIYHTQLTAFPDQASFCSTTVPCSTRYVWEFGFVSIPFMALAAFSFILAMLVTAAVTEVGTTA
jgi:disulfide bond formation protein DsbB